MTLDGWIIMLLSVGFVTGLFAWCLWMVLTTPSPEDTLHAPLEIDLPDRED